MHWTCLSKAMGITIPHVPRKSTIDTTKCRACNAYMVWKILCKGMRKVLKNREVKDRLCEKSCIKDGVVISGVWQSSGSKIVCDKMVYIDDIEKDSVWQRIHRETRYGERWCVKKVHKKDSVVQGMWQNYMWKVVSVKNVVGKVCVWQWFMWKMMWWKMVCNNRVDEKSCRERYTKVRYESRGGTQNQN